MTRHGLGFVKGLTTSLKSQLHDPAMHIETWIESWFLFEKAITMLMLTTRGCMILQLLGKKFAVLPPFLHVDALAKC